MFLLPWRLEILLVFVMRLEIWSPDEAIAGRGGRVLWFKEVPSDGSTKPEGN